MISFLAKYFYIPFIISICLLTSAFAAPNKSFISYLDVGKGEPLVFIHAFPTDQRLWNAQREGLKNHFRVITLDLWGFGQSSPVTGQAMTMTDYAQEVKQLLDQLNIQKAIIGGESMGGYVALAFLEQYPERVTGLILADTQAITDNEETRAKREASAIDILQNGSASFINGFMPKALSKNASEETKQQLLTILQSQAREAFASALRGMALRHDTSQILAQTELPVLIITGEDDILISPEQSLAMHKLAKNSKLVTLKNTAHLANLEQAGAWNQAVIDMFYSR